MNPRFETFSFLPPLSMTDVRKQADYMLDNGFVPVIEFLENPIESDQYWNLWRIPTDEAMTSGWIIKQIELCGRSHPYAHIRLSGYDCKRRMNAHSFIVAVPLEGA
ncbi:MAG: ribulose bisphosphate carboxylase small subunit [Proteobacteria bacterium]|nr:ribulose bisphosphate carboxylase small subunit [Pseudomonadota bacterium]